MPRLRPHQATRDLVARNFVRLLEEADTRIGDLSLAASVQRSILYRLRDADTGVTIDVLGRLAEALQCKVGEFFSDR
jgi:DNA-binding Xre family transcriptional regulator